jgi:1-acyl-sn-glycerol-3-phosphate acyltransferase
LLKAGPLDVRVKIGPPVPLEQFTDRKTLARYSEEEVRAGVVQLLRGDAVDRKVAAPSQEMAAGASCLIGATETVSAARIGVFTQIGP